MSTVDEHLRGPNLKLISHWAIVPVTCPFRFVSANWFGVLDEGTGATPKTV